MKTKVAVIIGMIFLMGFTRALPKGGYNPKRDVLISTLEKIDKRVYLNDTLYSGQAYNIGEEGQILTQNIYVDGVIRERARYYDSGALIDRTIYKNGKEDGVVRNYYESGELRSENFYKDGVYLGKEINYGKDGKVSRIGELKYDEKNGRKKFHYTYYVDGKVVSEEN